MLQLLAALLMYPGCEQAQVDAADETTVAAQAATENRCCFLVC